MEARSSAEGLRKIAYLIGSVGAAILSLLGVYIAGFGSLNETMLRVGTYAFCRCDRSGAGDVSAARARLAGLG
ncbi:hypothetical protein [Paracoccus tegillarcae]|uniref:hypothetical protein n=1 Tax=Paracoccus tegillarcae TaxID=1529068 RepID=UPI0013008783|nr:hypothetical protein [Paracoccus tegillarcae]